MIKKKKKKKTFAFANTMPFHIPWRTSPGHTICHAISARLYHVIPTRPYHMLRHIHQAIPNTMPCPPGYTIIPCYASPGHTIYYAMPAWPYLFPYHVRQDIPYTMPCPSGHTTYHAMPTRPYHIPYHTSQDWYHIYHISCHASPGHNIYHAMPQAIPYTLPCPPGHTVPCYATANSTSVNHVTKQWCEWSRYQMQDCL